MLKALLQTAEFGLNNTKIILQTILSLDNTYI